MDWLLQYIDSYPIEILQKAWIFKAKFLCYLEASIVYSSILQLSNLSLFKEKGWTYALRTTVVVITKI
jgi:hypothetical protein